MSGPGRPPVGRQIAVRIPDELIDWFDTWAAEHDTTRPAMIRDAMDAHRIKLERQARRTRPQQTGTAQ